MTVRSHLQFSWLNILTVNYMLKTVKVSFGPKLLSEKWQFADVLPTEMRLFYGKQDFESPIFRRALLKHNLPPKGRLWGPRSHGSDQGLKRWSDRQKPMEFPANQHNSCSFLEWELLPQVCCWIFLLSLVKSQVAGPILAPGQAKLLGQNRTTLHNFCLKKSKPAIGFPIFSMDHVFRWFWELILSNHSPSLSACAMGGGAPSLLVVKCFRGRWGYNQQNMGIDGNMIGGQQKWMGIWLGVN